MTSHEIPSDNWRALAEAIVVQATKDYRSALRGLHLYPENSKQLRQKRELEEFFRSRWFQTLCDLDGMQLICMLKNEVRGKNT